MSAENDTQSSYVLEADAFRSQPYNQGSHVSNAAAESNPHDHVPCAHNDIAALASERIAQKEQK